MIIVKCRFPNCHTTRLHRWGLCNKHRKWVEKGYYTVDLQQIKPIRTKYFRCKIKDCESKHRRNGFCSRHDSQYKRGSIDFHGQRIKPIIRYSKDFGCIKCGKTGKISKGFCKTHYAQYRSKLISFDGSPLRERKRTVKRYTEYDICKIPKCQNKPRCKGLCTKCHEQVKRGSMDTNGKRLIPELTINKNKTCIECNKPAHCKGRCQAHYWRLRHPRKPFINKGKTCSAIACKTPAITRGLCIKHYQRWKTKLRMPKSGARN